MSQPGKGAKAVRLLKIKGRKGDFFPAKAVRSLRIKPLKRNTKNGILRDDLPDLGDAKLSLPLRTMKRLIGWIYK